MDRIVLAYSGGLDTSVAVAWLAERYRAEVITVTMDLGQGDDLGEIRDRALTSGARRAHVLDLREEFASRYVLPALKADAADRYPIAAALGYPLIAEKMVEVAGIEQAGAVAYGRPRTPDDARPFDAATYALNPHLKVLAPVSECGMTRAEEIAYAQAHGIAVTHSGAPHVDANLWGRTIRCGVFDDRSNDVTEDMHRLTKAPADCPDEPAYVEVGFECGVPTSINGVPMPLLELIVSLGTIAGAHGVGRLDEEMDPRADRRSHELYEGPAAVALHAAHKELQAFVTSRDLDRFWRSLSLHYIRIVEQGLWFTPVREALDAFVERVQERATGVVRLKLFKGGCVIVGRRSAHTEDDLAPQSASGSPQPVGLL